MYCQKVGASEINTSDPSDHSSSLNIYLKPSFNVRIIPTVSIPSFNYRLQLLYIVGVSKRDQGEGEGFIRTISVSNRSNKLVLTCEI